MNAPSTPPNRTLRRPDTALSESNFGSATGKVRVMLIDDSLTVRTIFKRMVESDPGMEIVGTASSAERGISQLSNIAADVILLDLEMPGMGGLQALPKLLETGGDAQILVVSSLTDDGAEATMTALSMGAADTMLKPRPGGFNEEYRSQLLEKIRALGSKSIGGETAQDDSRTQKPTAATSRAPRAEVLAIGASTGGIHALNVLLRGLTPQFDLPILITQHLPASFMPVFARQVEVACARKTLVAEDGTEIRPGEVAIAPGHGHMIVRKIGDRLVTKTSTQPAFSGCMPSVDPMLSSLADACNGRVLAIILSGMGRDGLEGAQALKARGGTIFAQDAESSAVWGMPGAVTKTGLTSLVAEPEKLAEAIMAETLVAAAK